MAVLPIFFFFAKLLLVPQVTLASGTCSAIYLLQVAPYHTPQDDGWDRGLEVIPAARVAVRHINRQKDILNELELKVIEIPSEPCAVSTPYSAFVRVLSLLTDSEQRCVFGVIGQFCSSGTDLLTPHLSNPQFGYVQLTSATSPRLRDVESHPYLFSAVSSTEIYNIATLAMMKHLNWTRISVVYDYQQFFFRSTGTNFSHLLEANPNLTRVVEVPLADNNEEEIHRLVLDLLETASRITYLSVTIEESGWVMCEAFLHGLVWPWYAYIFVDRTIEDVLSYNGTSCTHEEIRSAVEGVFFIQLKLSVANETTLISGVTFQEYYEEYLQELRVENETAEVKLEPNDFANTLYDQVWSFAMAMNISLENYLNTSINSSFVNVFHQTAEVRKSLADSLEKLFFQGSTGHIEYGTTHEVFTAVEILQARNGSLVSIGTFNLGNESEFFNRNFNKSQVPPDTVDTIPYRIHWAAGITVVILEILTVAIIVISLLAIIYWRDKPEIKSTSLYISFLVLAGCLLLSFAPVVRTVINVFGLSKETLSILCNVNMWFSLYGIILIMVSLLYRLLRISIVFGSYHPTGKYWSDKYMIVYILASSCSVLLFLLIWVAVDPMRFVFRVKFISSAVPPFYEELGRCASVNTVVWLSISYGWVSLLLVLLILLAIKTRKIKRKHFKDTKKVNVFVFCITISFALFVPLTIIFQLIEFHILAYFAGVLADFCTVLSCQLLLFLPKYLPLLFPRQNKPRNVDTGLKLIMKSFDSMSPQTQMKSFDSMSPQTRMKSFDSMSSQTRMKSFDSMSSQTRIKSFDSMSSKTRIKSFDSMSSQTRMKSFDSMSSQTRIKRFDSTSPQTRMKSFDSTSPQTVIESV